MTLGFQETSARAYWLLDLEVGGVVYRFATERVEVATEYGDTLLYEGGLAEPSVSLVQDGAAEMSAGLTIESGDDWALIEARGQSLERARGILRRWWKGTTIERARLYLRGLSADIEYEAKEDPLSFSLERSPRMESVGLIDPQMIVDESTWPVRAGFAPNENVLLVPYTLPIGAPGHDPSAAHPRAAVPALMVEFAGGDTSSRVLLASGQMHAAAVRLHNATADLSMDATPMAVSDLLGRSVTCADFLGEFLVLNGDENEYWYGLQADSTYGGGVPNPFRPGEMLRGAGDVMVWSLLFHSTIRIDRGMMATHAAWLNQFCVDTYINAPINAWDWLSAAVLQWVPVIARESEHGLYFLPIRWDRTLEDVQVWLSVERGDITRSSAVKRLDQPIYNEITVRYRPKRESGKWWSSVTVTAQPGTLSGSTEVTEDARIIGSHLARISQANPENGVRPLVVDLPHTWDDATAVLVAGLLIDRYAFSKRPVQYEVDADLEAIEPGTVVAVSDARIHLTDAVGLVIDVTPSAAGAVLDVILLDNPALSPPS